MPPSLDTINSAIHATYTGKNQQLALEQSYLRTPQTNLTMNGTISKRSSLALHLEANDLREVSTIAGLFSTAGFGALTAFAMLHTSTGRTAICAYTMPIWTTFLGRIVLGERLTAWRLVSLGLGSAGLLVLLWPLVETGIPIGAIAAIGSAVSWATGTVYQKWAGIVAHPLQDLSATVDAYSIAIGNRITASCLEFCNAAACR